MIFLLVLYKIVEVYIMQAMTLGAGLDPELGFGRGVSDSFVVFFKWTVS